MTLSKHVTVRCTDETYKLIARAAAEMDLTVSQLMREAATIYAADLGVLQRKDGQG